MIETVRTDFFDGCIGRNEVEIDRVIGHWTVPGPPLHRGRWEKS